MASPIHQKEVVRLLTLEHGLKEAARLSGVSYDVVRQWSARGKWKHSHPVTSSSATVAADTVAAELQSHEKETRLSLARSTARMAKDAEQVTLRESKHVLNVAKTAAITHSWADSKANQANVMVNVALLGIDPERMRHEGTKVVEHELEA